ncbi:MAG: sigma-54-dependent Fis family transcriptional regulator [Nitrospirae bacterium]|nr:sigma-54-dependent Fis family transcriptional regulator [Nitrospirota bacterium]
MNKDSADELPVKATILVAEDKESMADMLRLTLEADGYSVIHAADGMEAIRRLREGGIDLVLTDLKMPKKSGLDVLTTTRQECRSIPFIFMTAFGTIELAVEAMRLGAYDFITKPFDTGHLLVKLSHALENRRLAAENIVLRDAVKSAAGLAPILGNSPLMLEAAGQARKVARARTTVLLLGESGTGKELFARAIHNLSPRAERPFVAVNCAAIPRDLLESELFGHEKGAFTGADQRRMGKFELADKGTLFLDEIGEMEISLQAKILRALQDGHIERVGGVHSVVVDVRVVAASNRDLEAAVAEKSFREDLYYRLNVFPIHLPPLRDRRGDIPALADYFIARYSRELGCPNASLSAEALEMLERHQWKGNVRELENAIERALILCDGGAILPEHLAICGAGFSDAALRGMPMDGTLDDAVSYALRRVETERIRRALAGTGGNKTRAAEILSVSYKTLLTKIKDYGIE